jgi:hypothetical protein
MTPSFFSRAFLIFSVFSTFEPRSENPVGVETTT